MTNSEQAQDDINNAVGLWSGIMAQLRQVEQMSAKQLNDLAFELEHAASVEVSALIELSMSRA